MSHRIGFRVQNTSHLVVSKIYLSEFGFLTDQWFLVCPFSFSFYFVTRINKNIGLCVIRRVTKSVTTG